MIFFYPYSILMSATSSDDDSVKSTDSSETTMSLNLNTLHGAMVFLMLHSKKSQKNLTVPFKYINQQVHSK